MQYGFRPRGFNTWAEWLKSREKKHVYTFRDDVVDIALKIVKDIWFMHNIKRAQFQYTKDSLHIEIGLPDGNYYGIVAFNDIDTECYLLSKQKSEELLKRIEGKLKFLILDSFGRR